MNQRFDQIMNKSFNNASKQPNQNYTHLKQQLNSINTTNYNTVTTADFDTIETQLTSIIIGQKNVIHQLILNFKRPLITSNYQDEIKSKILITGHLHKEKIKIINKLNELLYLNNIISSPNTIEIDLSLYTSIEDEKIFLQDLYSALSSQNSIIVFNHIDLCHFHFITLIHELLSTQKIMLHQRYIANGNQLSLVNNNFVKNTVNSIKINHQYLIFTSLQPYEKLISHLGMHFIQLFDDCLEMEMLSSNEILDTIHLLNEQFKHQILIQFKLNVIQDSDFESSLVSKYDKKTGEDSIQNIFDQLIQCLVEIQLHTPVKSSSIKINNQLNIIVDQTSYAIDHFNKKYISNSIDTIQTELNHLVGLTEIKKYIVSLKDFYTIQHNRTLQGLKTASISKHMIFTGNPGTGKTTIARIIAKYFKAIGILTTGQLIEVSRADLVGQYVGHTAPLTKKVIQSALGGVLFIDEAYSLYRGKEDSFGLEAIDTLIKEMEDHRDNLIVILAGYTQEMNQFLSANTGLKSRFPNIIEFPDYNANELLQIACTIAKNNDYSIDENAYPSLLHYFQQQQNLSNQRSGNGRMARNLVEQAMIAHAQRLLSQKETSFDIISLDDFNLKY